MAGGSGDDVAIHYEFATLLDIDRWVRLLMFIDLLFPQNNGIPLIDSYPQ